MTPKLILDAGAFIAWERNDQRIRALVELGMLGEVTLQTSSAVVAQVWRGGPPQARTARLLAAGTLDECPLDRMAARRIGVLTGSWEASDVVDGHVVSLALGRGTRVVTSDPDDLVAWGLSPDAIVRC